MRVDDANAREHEEERQRQGDAGHGAGQHQAEEQARLATEAEAREGVAARHPNDQRHRRRGDRDDQRIAEIVQHRNAALADAGEHRDIGVERQFLRYPDRRLGHDLDGRSQRRQHDPDARHADHQHGEEQPDLVGDRQQALLRAGGGIGVHRHHHSAPICVRAAASLRKK